MKVRVKPGEHEISFRGMGYLRAFVPGLDFKLYDSTTRGNGPASNLTIDVKKGEDYYFAILPSVFSDIWATVELISKEEFFDLHAPKRERRRIKVLRTATPQTPPPTTAAQPAAVTQPASNKK